ncbi:MAG: aminotransferase class V-fold PLP-dependent enzyme, partial [Bacteroidota bacterium]
MKKVFFTPGPSQLYPTVEAHLAAALVDQVGSISHRSQAFMDIYAHAEKGLRELLGIPADYSLFFMSSANEAWERIAQNCVDKKSFHWVTGSFSKRFRTYVADYGKEAVGHKVEMGKGFALEELKVPAGTELVAAIANETSTGVWTAPERIAAFRAKWPEPLLVVDAVSAYPAYQLDLTQVDGVYFSVQKGFGLPAGLGVLVAGPRMLAKAEALEAAGKVTGSYHSFAAMRAKAVKSQTPETPNVLGIYLLGKVVEDMNHESQRQLRAHIEAKAQRLAEYFEQDTRFSFSVSNPADRSPFV